MTNHLNEIVIDPYSSHAPLLAACVAATSGTVIELGSGLYSTPLLQSLCLAQGRILITVEHDRQWLSRVYDERGHHPNHRCILVDAWGDLDKYGEELTCDVAFIDLAPADQRAWAIDVMRRWARILIIHDTETEQRHNYPGVEERLRQFKYRVDDRRRGPWATAVSDSVDLKTIEEGIRECGNYRFDTQPTRPDGNNT